MWYTLALFYFFGFMGTLLLLSEDQSGKNPFEWGSTWAVVCSLFFPIFWGVVLIGSLIQLIRHEGK